MLKPGPDILYIYIFSRCHLGALYIWLTARIYCLVLRNNLTQIVIRENDVFCLKIKPFVLASVDRSSVSGSKCQRPFNCERGKKKLWRNVFFSFSLSLSGAKHTHTLVHTYSSQCSASCPKSFLAYVFSFFFFFLTTEDCRSRGCLSLRASLGKHRLRELRAPWWSFDK